MLKTLLWRHLLLLLLGIALLLKLFSLNASWVENGYTYGLYPVLSRTMRLLTGWLPISLGDLLYFVAGLVLIRFVWRSIGAIRQYGLKKMLGSMLYKAIRAFFVVYILFNVLWGLNYDRQ